MRTDVLGVGFDDLTLEEAAAAGAALVEAGGCVVARATASGVVSRCMRPPSSMRVRRPWAVMSQ